MSDTYDLFQQGRTHLRSGMPAQATVALEKQGRDHEANGHYKLARSLRPGSKAYAARIRDLADPEEQEG